MGIAILWGGSFDGLLTGVEVATGAGEAAYPTPVKALTCDREAA